jgi:hypothetical protein
MSGGTTDGPVTTDRGARELDPAIRGLYAENEGEVDTRDFAERLDARLASARRRRRSRPVIRRLALAGVAVVVLAGAGIGAWQGLEHLRSQRTALHFGDQAETSTTAATTAAAAATTAAGAAAASQGGTGWIETPVSETDVFSLDLPASVTQIKFADVWRQAVAQFAVDPAAARLDSLNVTWGGDGVLADFSVEASTPEGGTLSLFAVQERDAQGRTTQTLTFNAYHRASSGGRFGHFVPAPLAAADVLAAIDNVGLMQIGALSGLEVNGDPARLWEAYVQEGGFAGDGGVTTSDTNPYFANDEVGAVRWSLSGATSLITDAQEIADMEKWVKPTPTVLSISNGHASSIDGGVMPPSLLPAARFDLSRQWILVDKTTGLEHGARGGGSDALVLVSGLTDLAGSGDTVAAKTVDATLDGLAFATAENEVRRVDNGSVQTLWAGDMQYSGSPMPYGVAYSTGRSLLLYAGSVIKVTTDGSGGRTFEALGGREVGGGGMSGGRGSHGYGGPGEAESWSWESTGQSALMAIPAASSGGTSQELLRHPALPGLNRLRYDEAADTVWLSTFAEESGASSLWTIHPLDAQPEKVPLSHDFGGDFALSPDGSTILYVGTMNGRTQVSLRTAGADESLSSDLVTAYMPVFSPDGTKVCLVGARGGDSSTSLWLYDLADGTWTAIEATQGLTPTYPAFSPDGQRIAFRDWALGDIWTVDVGSGALTRYDLAAAEAAIAW